MKSPSLRNPCKMLSIIRISLQLEQKSCPLEIRIRERQLYLLSHCVTGGNQIRVTKVSDVVLIHGDCPRLNWKLGRIVELLQNEDDLCRGVVVRISGNKSVLRRSLQCLYPLKENTGDLYVVKSRLVRNYL